MGETILYISVEGALMCHQSPLPIRDTHCPGCRSAWSSDESLSGNCRCQGMAARLNEVDGDRKL